MSERKRRKSYDRRVETTALQLLGASVGESSLPAPEDPLHIGVAARLALLVAGDTDGTLLLSRARDTERVERRLRLVHEAVRTVRTWEPLVAALFLTGDVCLPVRCSGKTHLLRVGADETLSLLAHPSIDLESERLAAALGAELLPCAAAADAAARLARPPVGDDGPYLEFIGAGALAAFLGLVRRWLACGFDVRASGPALEWGLEPTVLASLLSAGLDVADAVSWRHASPDEVLRWRACGFDALASETWLAQGRALAELEELGVGVEEGPWVVRWARLVGTALGTEAVVEWARFGAPVGVWGDVAGRGMRASEAPAWTAAGFHPVEVLRFAHLRVPLHDALAWREAGFTGYVAAGCLGVGMTLADACALRGLPTRQVQELWSTCRSVDRVMTSLASFAPHADAGGPVPPTSCAAPRR